MPALPLLLSKVGRLNADLQIFLIGFIVLVVSLAIYLLITHIIRGHKLGSRSDMKERVQAFLFHKRGDVSLSSVNGLVPDIQADNSSAGESQMDPLTFVLAVASAVLANLISEFITGRTSAASEDDIRTRVMVELGVQGAAIQGVNPEVLQPRIVTEVLELAKHSRSLHVSQGVLTIASSPQQAQLELKQQLQNLNELVRQRRDEIQADRSQVQKEVDYKSEAMLSTEAQRSPVTPKDAAVLKWVRPQPAIQDDTWHQQLNDMQGRIHERRRHSRGTDNA